MWGPLFSSDVCWFISPSNYIKIITINHSYWTYKPIAILGASHHGTYRGLRVSYLGYTVMAVETNYKWCNNWLFLWDQQVASWPFK
jgi:uncharacterized membrane protein